MVNVKKGQRDNYKLIRNNRHNIKCNCNETSKKIHALLILTVPCVPEKAGTNVRVNISQNISCTLI